MEEISESPEFSIIVEAYTLNEGGAKERFDRSLNNALAIVDQQGDGEVLVLDVTETDNLQVFIDNSYPQVRRISLAGSHYDKAKTVAAREARGKFLLYLDGDCIPQPGWQQNLLDVLRRGEALACGGFTRYEGGWFQSILSVMDFGFFYPVEERVLQCYAFNNMGISRKLQQACPPPETDMRCACFYHAQCLIRNETPVMFVPAARVLHEAQPVVRERTRQGYDAIAACWADPELRESKWLRLGLLSIPLFFAMKVVLDWQRVSSGRRDLDLDNFAYLLALPMFPLLRLLDVAGMMRAIFRGPVRDGWGGYGS